MFVTVYRDPMEALRARTRALEAELASLRGQTPAEPEWTVEAHAESERRLRRRLVLTTIVTAGVMFAPALWGGTPKDSGLVAAAVGILMMFWTGSANAVCSGCGARLSRAVRKGLQRRCDLCKARIHADPPGEATPLRTR
jgi:hypothetical protein